MGRFLPDILEQHLEELDELTERRAHAFRVGEQTARSVAELDARLLAHVDGLAIAEAEALPLLEEALGGDEAGLAAAAALALLWSPVAGGARRVMARLEPAEGDLLDALGAALGHAPARAEGLDAELERVAREAPPPAAAAATAALARQDRLAGTERLAGLLADEQGARWALEAVAHLAAVPGELATELERWARHEDAAFRSAALRAAAWTGQEWLPGTLRARCAGPAAGVDEEHRLLAALGDAADLPAMLALGEDEALGPGRCALLAAHGHPDALPLLVKLMDAEDPATAAAAADAYAEITGVAMLAPGERVAAGGGEGAEEDDFAEDFGVPDVDRARAHCESTRARFSAHPRWLKGRPEGDWDPLAGELSVRSRQTLCLGRRMRGAWKGRRADFDDLPLKVVRGPA